jgi:hypothetical protein
MNIREHVEIIRDRVRRHGNYRGLSEKSLVGYEWLSKFAAGTIDNPTVNNVSKLETFFEKNVSKE